jgi:hypothetical protein
MKRNSFISWIGLTDLRASRGELRDGIGPIANAASARKFDEIHLLSDHPSSDTKAFVKWLSQQTGIDAEIWPVSLSGPTRFSEIYEAAVSVLRSLESESVVRNRTFHVSPGTPAMAAVWVLLAKTSFPAELIESSAEEGVRTISLPFEIAVDYIPRRDIEGRAAIDEFSMLASALTAYTSTTLRSPLTANDFSSPRMKATTTKIKNTTNVRASSVSAVREGRRSRLRIPYSQGSSRC